MLAPLVLSLLCPQSSAERYPAPALAPDSALTLDAVWDPCRASKYGLFERTAVLKSPHPAEEHHTYAAAAFAPFLPPSPAAVGDTWAVAPEAVLVFLRQFDASARAKLHVGFGAYEGTWACLRAASPTRLEILFRAHAEFELAGGVTYTPAQFEGRLLIERERGRPLALSLALPDRNTNVDVNVPLADQPADFPPGRVACEADIGWVPRMQLVGGTSEAILWPDSVFDEEARHKLRERFYPFEKLEWLPFADAVARAREEHKPLHVVVLFGTLDDEAC